MNRRPHILTISQVARRWALAEEDVIGYIVGAQLDVRAFVIREDSESGRSRVMLMDFGNSRDRNSHLWRYVVHKEPFDIAVYGDHRDGPDEPLRPGTRILRYSGKLEDLRILMDEVERFEVDTGMEVQTAKPARTSATRKTRLRIAVEKAREYLFAKFKREPTAAEVIARLEDDDPTGCVDDYEDGALLWIDAKGGLHRTAHASIKNMLTRIRKGI
jgi:hypothetical protein